MAKVLLNASLAGLKGALGGIVFKIINGKLYATQRARPKKKRKKWSGTPKQVEWRTKFHLATKFAKAVKENPVLLAHYQALAKKHSKRLRDICLSDYFTSPQIEAVDLSGYTGQPGSTIRFRAFEKYPLAGATVYIGHADGTYEDGPATGRGRTWTYTAQRAMPPGKVNIQLSAHDHAGQSTAHRCEWSFGVQP